MNFHATTVREALRRSLARAVAVVLVLVTANRLDSQTAPTSMSAPIGVPMERAASGTTWIPDAVTLPSAQFMAGDWMTMLHGFAFGQVDKQGSKRGSTQLGSLNWMMLMASRNVLGGRLQPRAMLSLDPWTGTPSGYPLLMQSGETFHGEPLHDRQHPHDFFMELAASYERPLTTSLGWQLYVAPSGEPSLGPVAFMHRPSAMDNPTAPLSHHWQDATHVSFGVVTAGLFSNRWKLEASAFNGREPDENRWNLDRVTIDSYSGRFTLNPTRNWSFSASFGFLASPEAHEPSVSLHRVSASALYGRALGTDGQWSTTFVYGANQMSDAAELSNSWLLESEAVIDRKNTVFTRLELVQKSAADLVVDVPGRFNVAAATLGGVREVVGVSGATVGVGVSGTVNVVPLSLRDTYGTRTPLGGMLFVRLRPAFPSRSTGMQEMHMHIP